MKVTYINTPIQALAGLSGANQMSREQARHFNAIHGAAILQNQQQHPMFMNMLNNPTVQWEDFRHMQEIGRDTGAIIDHRNLVVDLSIEELNYAQGVMRDLVMLAPAIQSYRSHGFIEGYEQPYEPKPLDLTSEPLWLSAVNGYMSENNDVYHRCYYDEDESRVFSFSEQMKIHDVWDRVEYSLSMGNDPTALIN